MNFDDFLSHNAVISITKGTPWEQIEELQACVDAFADKQIRFGTGMTIAEVLKHRWVYDPICIAYDDDNVLVYCDTQFYEKRGKEIYDIGECLINRSETGEEFFLVLEA